MKIKYSQSDRVISTYHSGVFDLNGSELVILPNYNDQDKFGYFVAYERQLSINEFEYHTAQVFIEKKSEESYQQALFHLRRYILENATKLKIPH